MKHLIVIATLLFFLPVASAQAVDKDKDGMPAKWEKKYKFSDKNPKDARGDKDLDGLTNRTEYRRGLNPRKADTDGDGLPDGWEVTFRFNAKNQDNSQKDTDGDGLTNIWEYKLGTNPRKKDSDKNNIADGLEDTDGDRLTNRYEISIGTDPTKADSDNNGVEDGYEDHDGNGIINWTQCGDECVAEFPPCYYTELGCLDTLPPGSGNEENNVSEAFISAQPIIFR